MGEEFQGGVCGSMWWNPPHSLFSGELSSPCSVVQLGGGFDMGNFGWPNKSSTTTTTTTNNNNNNNNNQVFDNLIFQDQIDSSLDILGFGLSPTSSTTDWNHQNLMCNNSGSNEGNNFDPFLQDNMNDSRLYSAYSMVSNNSTNMVNSNNTNNTINYNNNTCQDASPPMTLTASSNSSGESSTITFEGGLTTSFPMNSSASYLIQSLFDDSDDQFINNNNNNSSNNNNNNPSSYGSMDSNEIISSNSWVKTSLGLDDQTHHLLPQLQLLQSNCNKLNNNGGIVSSTMMNNNSHGQILSGQYSPTTLNNIKASLLNSLQSRSRGPNSFNQKSQSCATSLPNEMNGEEHQRDSKSNNNDQPQAKRTRIETPSPLPTFKVRKEKLGDRITALQQLVSPFGKTDTASVLHEAIEYIKFLHDQVHVLSTPYLKSGTAMQQQDSEKSKDNEVSRTQQDLRGRGLCLVPISSTYPVAQETPVDFWTPTFGGTTFRNKEKEGNLQDRQNFGPL